MPPNTDHAINTKSATFATQAHFSQLTPDTVMNAAESLGYYCNGRHYALNSYENRVYQLGLDDLDLTLQHPTALPSSCIAKFYRCKRWSHEQILEEHQWTEALQKEGLAIATPMTSNVSESPAGIANTPKQTLFEHADFGFALYPHYRGDAPDLDDPEQLYAIGQSIGQLHAHNSTPFQARLTLTPQEWGNNSQQTLLNSGYMPRSMRNDYQAITNRLLEHIHKQWDAADFDIIKLHGDCHRSNILWHDNAPTLLDFDDACNGPALQDLWMLISGSTAQQQQKLAYLIEGYEEFTSFNDEELTLTESLRTLRIMHYAAWLASRQDDSAFKQAFPWFGTESYWQQHLKDLQEQQRVLKNNPSALLPKSGNC